MADATARLRGRKGVEQRLRRLRRTSGLCERCEKKNPKRYVVAVHVDHITPLAKGGPDTDDNTQNLCLACHDEKTRQDFGHRRKPQIGNDGWPIG